MDIQASDLSPAEIAALIWVREAPSTLISHIPDKSERDVHGDPVPGMRVFKRLESKGLLFQTEEEPFKFTDDPDEEPFLFTESIELTSAGMELAKSLTGLRFG
jgi:hypothetical protein